MKEFGITLYSVPKTATTPQLLWEVVQIADSIQVDGPKAGTVLSSGTIIGSKIFPLLDGAELRVREA